MKSILNFIRSLLSIGFLGWIFLFMAIALLVGTTSAVSNFDAFDITWQRIDALNALEDQVSNHLREMELNEVYYAFTMEYGMEPSDELDTATSHASQIHQIFDDLIAEGHFTAEMYYSDEIMGLINGFRTALEQHQQTVIKVASAYESGEIENAWEYLAESEAENNDLHSMLQEIIANVESERLEAAQQFPLDITFAIQGISVAVIFILLLALWGYRGIALLTQPLINLTNAVIATGGDQYRPELTTAERKLRNPAGRMARSLDTFAKTIQQRDAAQKQEITNLREKLYESRRSRLKISGPSH